MPISSASHTRFIGPVLIHFTGKSIIEGTRAINDKPVSFLARTFMAGQRIVVDNCILFYDSKAIFFTFDDHRCGGDANRMRLFLRANKNEGFTRIRS